MENDGPLWRLSATAAARRIAAGEISATEMTQAHLDLIERLDPILQAFITVDTEGAMDQAKAADAARARGDVPGPLHGVPVSFKDLVATKGLRTTYGSLVHKDWVPDADDVVVARVRAAGGVVIGKTNTPEFGFGAICQNKLRGPTLNPYALRYTSGGSSGGAAVAAATGMSAVSHGSDFGGSCRIPAAFCGIFGFRPSAGRIANPRKQFLWNDLTVDGVLARTVEDVALLVSVFGQPHPLDPTSRAPGFAVPEFSTGRLHGVRIGFRTDLGIAPIDGRVRSVVEAAIARIGETYPATEEACPDFSGAMEAFMTLRGPIVHQELGTVVEQHRDLLTPSVVWNADRGKGVAAADCLKAEEERGRIFRSAANFFEDHDFLISATTSIPAFPNDESDVLLVDGKPMAHILDYAKPTAAISLIGLPALSVPCGFTADGLPVGIQIVARPFDEGRLFRFAFALQEELGFRHHWPPDAAASG